MKKRIMWIFFAVTAAALVVFSVISTYFYYRSSITSAKDALSAYMGAFDETRTEETLDGEYAAQLSERLNGVRVTFLTAEGELIADSEDGEEGSRTDRPEVRQAIEEGEGYDVRSSATLGKNLVYYCRNFGGYLVRLALPANSVLGIYRNALPSVAVFLVADAMLCLLLTYFLTGYMLRPAEQLARDAARGERVHSACPELAPVAEIMNRMNEEKDSRLREIDRERELVEQAQKSKNEFIANITHEMNTPLTSIKGFAELLAAGALEGDRAKKAAQTILAQSERLTGLVASVIGYSEIDSERLPSYEVNASSVIRDILAALAPAVAEKKLALHTDICDDVLLESRTERLYEVFGNIVRNAIRYTEEGGSVTVSLSREEFCVADTGVGIAQADLPRIFDRFYTVDKSHSGKHGGFGLGLSVVKKLCEKAGWQIAVESKLGEGSRFCVRFSAVGA